VKIKNKLNEDDGSGMIETCIGVFVFVIILSIILQTVGVLIYKYRMGIVADKICEVIASEGQYDTAVQDVINEYLKSSKLNDATISLDKTEYMPGKNKIQMNDKIVVQVTAKYSIGFGDANISIDLNNVSETRSGVYWK